MAPIPEKDWLYVKDFFKEVRFEKKDRLLDFGHVAEHYFFIVEGLVRLYGFKDGEEKTLFFFSERMLAGSIQSYRNQTPSQLVMEALEPVNALAIHRDQLMELHSSSQALLNAVYQSLQIRFQELLKLYSSFVLDTAEERYIRLQDHQPDLLNRVPQHVLASFLGVTPVSLSRIRKRIAER